VIALLFALLLVSCQTADLPHIEKLSNGVVTFEGNAMTMHYKVMIGHEIDASQMQRISSIIWKTFDETNTILNKWNPYSELSKLNQQKSNVSTPLSPILLRLFKETDHIVTLSEGRFDPTIESIQNLWREKLKIGTIPQDFETQKLAPAVGWDKISFKGGFFKKENDLTKLDFGGIAKGLCVDILVENLLAEGFQNIYVEWGGEIRVAGEHPQNRPWTIFISRLGDMNSENAIATLKLENQAIATSGDYLQNWNVIEEDTEGNKQNVTYFHIFDPKSLKPIKMTPHSVASTSVVAANCALADGLATVPMMFSTSDEALLWAEKIKEKYPEIAFWIISRQ
jgi:thiamine biosynthesis lipoprotein